MENISAFLRACRDFGVQEYDLFETVDLFEEKDLGVVLQCISSLGRALQKRPGYNGPTLGPRESSNNTRNFSSSQQREQSRNAAIYGSKQTVCMCMCMCMCMYMCMCMCMLCALLYYDRWVLLKLWIEHTSRTLTTSPLATLLRVLPMTTMLCQDRTWVLLKLWIEHTSRTLTTSHLVNKVRVPPTTQTFCLYKPRVLPILWNEHTFPTLMISHLVIKHPKNK